MTYRDQARSCWMLRKEAVNVSRCEVEVRQALFKGFGEVYFAPVGLKSRVFSTAGQFGVSETR